MSGLGDIGDKPKRYSAVRYWRYVFTPILMFGLLLGLFILFTSSDAQTASYNTLVKRTSTSLAAPTAPFAAAFGTNILQNLQNLQADPSAP